MKIEIIRNYDIGIFKDKIEEMYKTKDIDHIDTHTEVLPQSLNNSVIWFIAIIFYKEKDDINEA